ncbi:hypothetical protein [Streptomyces erythrochromogenes]|uniref:hypothetical protein n=1 Tax=Streptomyces erythrochromogenes TaxID=285574 RepID=UPI0038630C60|nr:hypothetical protein OG489_01255 [Streptomyces erythrochromogenes]
MRADRRTVAIELTAPAAAEPTVFRVTDVSAAGAEAFADAVNAALPARAEGEPVIDGATLVVTRSLVSCDDEGDGADDNERPRGLPAPAQWVTWAAIGAIAVLAVAVGVADGNWGRGIATLLLGELGVGAGLLTWAGLASVREGWYLRRHGITVESRQVYRNGTDTNAYTATDGVTRHVGGTDKGRPVRVAYHPRKPETAVVLTGLGDQIGGLVLFLAIAGITGLIGWGVVALALPAFDG